MNLAETREWAFSFYSSLSRPCVVLLDGDLGAGKTQLVKWFLEAAGFSGASSPTYAIHQEYVLASGLAIDHVDLYRVVDDSDLESSGFWDLFRGSSGLVFVEWADRLPVDAWPEDWSRVFVRVLVEGDGRRVEVRRVAPGSDPNCA